MIDDQPQDAGLEPLDYVRPLWAKRWLILVVVVVATAVTYAYSSSRPTRYVAHTSVFLSGKSLANADDPDRVVANLAVLGKSSLVTRAAAQRLGYRGDLSALRDKVTVSPSSGSDFLDISAEDGSATGAARIANAFAQGFISQAQHPTGVRLRRAVQAARTQLSALGGRPGDAAARQRLQARISDLQASARLPRASAEQVQAARPPRRALSPRPKRDATFALVLSLLFGASVAYLVERFDRRLKRLRDLESHFTQPVLAQVPREPRLSEDPGHLSEQGREAFRTLCANVRLAALDLPIRSLLVVSALAREGKSLVVRGLAMAYREAGQRVAVVEADLRHPSLAQLFRVQPMPGLTDVLTGGHELQAALHGVGTGQHGAEAEGAVVAATEVRSVPASTNGGSGGSVDVLPGGTPAANPSGVLAADRVRNLLEEIAGQYDVLLIDSAPLLAVSDAIPLLALADGVILVSRLGVSTRESAHRTTDLLSRAGANVLGVVANEVPPSDADPGYQYDTGLLHRG